MTTGLARIAGVGRFVRSAPLTYLWLTVLLVTTILQHIAGRQLQSVLVDQSTNLHHLATDPLEVLFASLLWIDGKDWMPYLVLFTLFLAPAERWLGHLHWLAVGLIAHIGATYLSEGALYLLIDLHLEPERLVYARDIGVSYFLVGVLAVLTYRIASPWRWGYLAVLVIIYAVPLVIRLNFTAIGHASAILIGLGCYPLTRAPARPPGLAAGGGIVSDSE